MHIARFPVNEGKNVCAGSFKQEMMRMVREPVILGVDK